MDEVPSICLYPSFNAVKMLSFAHDESPDAQVPYPTLGISMVLPLATFRGNDFGRDIFACWMLFVRLYLELRG